jgi:hypothetical protein
MNIEYIYIYIYTHTHTMEAGCRGVPAPMNPFVEVLVTVVSSC